TAGGKRKSSSITPSSLAVGERALDALGELLRVLGDMSFDVEGEKASAFRRRCDAWARHLLIGAAHPEGADEQERSGRDFRGLGRLMGVRRRAEVEVVRRLRELVGQTAERIAKLIHEGEDGDQRLERSLRELEQAAAGGDVRVLRARVDATVKLAETIFSERRARHAAELEAVSQHMAELRGQLEQARLEASTDPLTQVFNRASLDRHLDAVVQLAGFTDEPASLLMVDVDHFKRINDEHGHVVGDHALRGVADNIVRVASRRTDFVARYGGEEFAVILADTPHRGAARVAERLVAIMKRGPIAIPDGPSLAITVSVGVATLRPGESPEEWVRRADQALYAAKNGGRDRYVLAA
ncbi:MAG TPA: diguanylate cyclase, partial [Polyangiaceae bacterium]|nr:diguanylate cyclase [Polyangiaceae bacterium]